MLWIVTLEAFDERHGERAGQERILAVAFFRSSPTDVAGEIGIGCPDDQAAAMPSRALKDEARLIALDGRGLAHGINVPRLTKADGLRKDRGRHGIAAAPVAGAAVRQPVEALDVPGALDAESRHFRVGPQGDDLFIECESRDEVGQPLGIGKIRISEWRVFVCDGGGLSLRADAGAGNGDRQGQRECARRGARCDAHRLVSTCSRRGCGS